MNMNYEQLKTLDEQYYFPVFGQRQEAVFARGDMQYMYDIEGKKYTDFLGAIACVCLGHGHPKFNAALNEQIANYISCANYFYNEPQAKLVELLCTATKYEKAFICSSGAEANEGAIKLARKVHFNKGENRTQIITCTNSFHGRTLATLAATGQDRFHAPYKPLMETFDYVAFNNCEELKSKLSGNTCAVILEVIQGEGGVIPATQEFVTLARKLCDEYGAQLIFDEVQTGMGRTGKLLAQEHFGILGDITTLAKSLGNGFPVGAFIARGEAAKAFTAGDHGSTYGGNALACTAAYTVLSTILEENLCERVEQMGVYFMETLKNNLKNKKSVLDIRGKGLIIGVELSTDYSAPALQKELLKRGFMICTAGRNTLRFLPSYCIQKSDIDSLVGALLAIL